MPFKSDLLNTYNHFMTYTIKNKIFNIVLTIIENMPILIAIDFMWMDDFLSTIFTPFYFLVPHVYLDRFNSLFSNECSSIILSQDPASQANQNLTGNSNSSSSVASNSSNIIFTYFENLLFNKGSKYSTNSNNKSLNFLRQLQNATITPNSNSSSEWLNATTNLLANLTNGILTGNSTNLDPNSTSLISNLTANATQNSDAESPPPEPKIYPIKFFSNVIMEFDNTFCIYNPTVMIIFYCLVTLILVFFLLLGKFQPKTTKKSCVKYSIVFFLVNFINFILRAFGYLFFIVFLNRPIILLYQSNVINKLYFSNVIIYTVISFIFFCFYLIFCILFNKYITNAFFFEEYPYDFFSTSDTTNLQVIKILIGFKFNFDKLTGFRYITFINYLLGLFIFIRMCIAVADRQLIINNYLLKTLRNFFAFFFCIYLFLKLMNNSIAGLRYPNEFGIVIEMLIIAAILFFVITKLLAIDNEFIFKEKEEIINEILRFFYLMDKKLINSSHNKVDSGYRGSGKKKQIQSTSEHDSIIDDILIGHKMKCTDEECSMCEEQINSPDSKSLFKIIYHQFLGFEKDLKEENEELCLIIKILLLKVIDDDKIHRISYLILKNTKVPLSTYLKINYIYDKLLDEMNQDLKNLLTIKYGEIYDDLLFIINYFEEIFGFVKSRTEKVELVINKTNDVGQTYQKIIENLFFLKRNKRIYIDTYNMLQIICLIRLIFQRNVDAELTENLEYNFQDFLENVDRIFEENLSFIVRYDFYDFNWRIKKVPKTFMDMTRLRVDDLIDQSLEKIFPSFMAKSIIKELEELIMANKYDDKINFKTFVLDSESNVRYVKFEIEIIPNLHGNYLLFLHCHFQRKQVMIIDEAGNFVNGCEELYKKIGIKSEVVAMSRGKINMFNVFNVDKNCKLEDVKIVSVNIDNLIDIIKRVYLIENENLSPDTIPPFLYDLFFSTATTLGNHHGSLIANNTQNLLTGGHLGSQVNLYSNVMQSNIAFNQAADFAYNASNISKTSGGAGNNGNKDATGSQITISVNNNLELLRNNPNALNLPMNQNMRRFRDNNLIYLNLYETINLNNKKYIVYSIKIKSEEQLKKENYNNNNNNYNLNNNNNKNEADEETANIGKFPNAAGNINVGVSNTPNNKGNFQESTISASRDRSGAKSNNPTESDPKQSDKYLNTNGINNLNNNNNIQTHNVNDIKNNVGDYFNYFYDTNRSASVEIDYTKYNPNSAHSHGNSSTSDVFSFLLLKNAPKNSNRTHYFKNFLSFIYLLNLFLVTVGLFSIIYSSTYTKNTLSFIEAFEIFYTLRTSIISATANILAMSKFTNEETLNFNNSNNTNLNPNSGNNLTGDLNSSSSTNGIFLESFDEYFLRELNMLDLFSTSGGFSFDTLIKDYNSYYSEMILDSYKKFEKSSYNIYGATDFEKNINYFTSIIIFNSIGNTVLTRNKISDTLDYIPITINTIDKRPDEKVYINVNYLSFESDFITQSSRLQDPSVLSNLSLYERNSFNQNYNLYKFFINYFSVYVKNFQKINKSFFNFGVEYTNNLQLIAKILLIMIVVMHVLFVLVSLLSIFIYKKILLKEFNSLYSMSEESLTKLKEKFKSIEEIIKSEKYPSKVYLELRRMRELENNEKNANNKPQQPNNNSNKGNSGATKSKTKIIGLNNSSNFNRNSYNNPGINLNQNTQMNPKLNSEFPSNNNNLNNHKVNLNEKEVTKHKSNFLSPNNDIITNGKGGGNNTKIDRKVTGVSQSNNDSKDLALENYYSYNYSGATLGLQKSMSIKNKEKMEEIKKQHSKAQASLMLLSRLNFEFEFINNYVKFIVFMSVFYITLGVSVLLILEQKFDSFNKSLVFMNIFIEKNVNIYNYLIGVKLAIMLNRKWPNTIKPEEFGDYANFSFADLNNLQTAEDIANLNSFGFYSEQGILSNFDSATNQIFEMEAQNAFFSDIYNFESSFTGENTCNQIYSVDNEIFNNLKAQDPQIITNLIALCKKIPIMHSNLASIFTNVVRELREILNDFSNNSDTDLIARVTLLQNKFRMVDTIYFIFIEPYFKHIRDKLLQEELNSVVMDYFNFLIIIFTLNIFIDFLMLIFIWFKNYKQVIKYVNNIQLVADSITN